MQGYAAIGLDNPKNNINIGSTFRAAGAYDARLLVIGGKRPRKITSCTDTMNMYKHIPSILVDSVFDALPYGCVPVAVDIIPGAQALPSYIHPERAFYIFGAEDATLGTRITNRCRDIIYIPTKQCMNLAAAVNVILYDRVTKRNEWPKTLKETVT